MYFGAKRATALFVSVAMLVSPAMVDAAAADPAPTDANYAAAGLRDFAQTMGGLGTLDTFSTPLPLTRRSQRELLRLDTIFDDTLGNAVSAMATGGGGTAGGLQSAINGADLSAGSDGIAVDYSNVSVTDDNTTTQIAFDVTVTATRDLPLDYVKSRTTEDGEEELLFAITGDSGTAAKRLHTTVTLASSFSFSFDDGTSLAGALPFAFRLNTAPTVNVEASASNSSVAVGAIYGVTKVDVTGHAGFDYQTQVGPFTDPDGQGGVTQSEWQNTLAGDLLSPVALQDGTGTDLDVALNLNSTLISGSPDGTLTWTTSDRSTTPPAAAPTLDTGAELGNFANVGADDMLAGVGQFVTALQAAEAEGDLPLPFLKAHLSDGYSPAAAIADYVKRQSDAVIVCGKTDTNPPGEKTLPGDTWYCQAYAAHDPKTGSVTWTIKSGAGTASGNATDAATVGVGPTKNAVFTNVVGEPEVTVVFQDPDTTDENNATVAGEIHTVDRRFSTVDELQAGLQRALFGATVPSGQGVTLDYDESTDALTFAIKQSTNPASFTTKLDFGDSLRPDAHLVNPVPASEADGNVAVDLGTVDLDLAFGVSLKTAVGGLEPANADDKPKDRFFAVVDTDAGDAELSIGDLTVTPKSAFVLNGAVGFLGVTATSDSFTIERHDSADPLLTVDIAADPASGTGSNGTGVSNSVLLSHVIDEVDSVVTAVSNLEFSGRLLVAPNGELSSVITGTRGIDLSFDPVTLLGSPTVDPDADYVTDLVPWDLTPEVSGFATGATASTVLTDADAHFLTSFGFTVAAGTELDLTVFNRTTGASCTAFKVLSDTTLQCAGDNDTTRGIPGLTGGTQHELDGTQKVDANQVPLTDNNWNSADHYEVRGEQNALGNMLLEAYVDLANQLDRFEGANFREPLPLIGASPRDLVPQFGQIRDDFVELKTALAADGEGDPDTHAITQAPPKSLQELAAAIRTKLGLSASELVLSLEDLATPAASGATTPHLVAKLGSYDASGTQANAPANALGLQLPIGPADLTLLADEGQHPSYTATWSSAVQLDLAIPLDPAIDPNNVLVLGTTGVSDVSVNVDGTAINVTGNYSAMALKIGTDAFKTGTHKERSGTHTQDPYRTGTASETKVTGTDDRGASGTASTTVLQDSTKDFTALGVETGYTLSNTTQTSTCFVATVQTHSLTCTGPLSNSADWSNGDGYTYTWTSPRVLTTTNTSGAANGMIVENTTDNAWCTITAVTSTKITCSSGLTSGASWDKDDAFRVTSPTVLHDDNTDFTSAGVGSGNVIVNTTDNASCTVSSVTTHEVTCGTALAKISGTGLASWHKTDAWTLNVPGRLYDPGAKFDTLNIATGVDTIQNTTDNTSCTIGTVTADTITCSGSSVVWDKNDAYKLGAVDDAKLKVGYDLLAAGAALLDPADPANGFMAQLDGSFHNTTSGIPDCGHSQTGDLCARLSLKSNDATGNYLGVVEFKMDFGNAPVVVRPGALTTAQQGGEPLDFGLLDTSLPFLSLLSTDYLDGSTTGKSIGLVGEDLDAGAEVPDALAEVANGLNGFGAGLGTPANVGALRTAISNQVKAGIALATGVTRLGEPTITFTCTATCQDSGGIGTVNDVRVTVPVGGNLGTGKTAPEKGCANASCGSATFDAPFDLGVPGLQLTSPDTNLVSQAAWSLSLDFGLSRDDGPYLGTSGADELKVGALVKLPDAANADCTEDKPADQPDSQTPSSGDASLVSKPSQFSSDRCFDARLGLLTGTLFDGADTTSDFTAPGTVHGRTRLDLLTTVNLANAAGETPNKLTLDALLLDKDGSSVTVDADANMDVYFKTRGASEGSPGLPPLFGSIHLLYDTDNVDAQSQPQPVETLEYRDVFVDLTSFWAGFLGPILKDIKSKVGPIVPFVDKLTTPIPVVSDVSEKTGNGPVTLYDLLEIMIARKRAKATTPKEQKRADMIRTFLSLMKAIDGMGGLQAATPGIMGLGEVYAGSAPHDAGVRGTGGFKVDTQGMTGTCGATADGKKLPKDCQRTTTRKVNGALTKGQRVFGQSGNDVSTTQTVKQLSDCPASGCTGKELSKTVTKQTTKGITGYGLPTFPFLSNANEMYGMLLGKHATLVHEDFGYLQATGALSISFGPFMAGPVPIDVSIGLAVTVDARLVMGYDTKGLTGGGIAGTGNPIDGIYIDDLDKAGNDVPEVRFLTTVTLGASVSIKVFRVGLEGGVTLSILLDLQDPDHDGKLRLQEIKSFGRDPWCMFSAQGTLEFFLRFFVEIDLTFWSKKWTWEPWRLKPPITLFNVQCTPPQPVLASPSGADLLLNIGSRASTRAFEADEINEEFTVRQLEVQSTTGNTRVSVDAFGIHQEYTVGLNGKLKALDAGTGNDVVLLQSGADSAGTEIPFTLPSEISMGAGNNRVEGGAGADTITTGADKDVVKAGPGNDVVDTGAGKDVIDGGLGNDILKGGADDDRVTGGAGGDVVRGNAGDDDVSGGPGLNATVATLAATKRYPNTADAAKKTALIDALQDKADVLIGGDGDDELKGLFGGDWLFGDDTNATYTDANLLANAATTINAASECSATGGAGTSNRDRIDGESDNDHIYGGAGADQLNGGKDADTICGNDGADVLEGDIDAPDAPGYNDDLFGGAGTDSLFGRNGDDSLDGGPDQDLLMGGGGDDRMKGGLGPDAIEGESGKDIILGDTGTIPTSSSIGVTGNSVTGIVADTVTNSGTVECASAVSVIDGRLDLNRDNAITAADSGQVAGYSVVAGDVDINKTGVVSAEDNGKLLDLLIVAGRADMNTDSAITAADDGLLQIVVVRAAAGTTNADCISGGDGADAIYAGGGADHANGDDGADLVAGGDGADEVRGAQMDDELRGDAGADTMYGDSGNDAMYGGADNDTMHGGLGLDAMEGNGGGDTMFGESQDDSLIGGSSTAGADDGADTIEGNIGNDVIVGDNGAITGTGIGRTVVQYDMPTTANAGLSTKYGNDVLKGGADADRVYGGGGNDTITTDEAGGVSGADYAEGNGGNDSIDGGPGNDSLIGGSSTAGVLDGADAITGGTGDDVVAGDNATITAGVIARLDDATTDDTQDNATSGGDTISAGLGADKVQAGGGDDLVYGDDPSPTESSVNGGIDAIQGNAGRDVIYGHAGADLLTGGSDTAGVVDENVGGAGDTIHGGSGADTLIGDNGILAGGAVTRYNDATGHDTDDDHFSGDDTLNGNAGADLIVAGGGDDVVSGGTENDRIQGNAGADTINGNDGTDEIIGGSDSSTTVDENVANHGDTIHGDAGDDKVLGDNGTIASGVMTRFNDVFAGDGEDDALSGDDTVYGDAGTDTIQAQGGDDTVYGDDLGTAETTAGSPDVIQGNAGRDHIYAHGGNDKVNGGTDAAGRVDENVGGEGDTIYGGSGDDDIAGDNAAIAAGSHSMQRFDDKTTNDAADDIMSGDDVIDGGAGNDLIEAGGGNDIVNGGTELDKIQGNAGSDTVSGDAGDDQVIGGSDAAGVVDENVAGVGDLLEGNAGNDTIAGDNATIHPSTLVISRFDDATANDGQDDVVSGDDTIRGGADRDVIHAQGGNDIVTGGLDKDVILGNAGADLINGNEGDDDISGGSNTAGVVDENVGGVGDTIHGDDGDDVILGDNGFVGAAPTRAVTRLNDAITDDTADDVTSGNDTITGDAGLDLIEAQGGNDLVSGGTENDRIQGNAGTDNIVGNEGDDAILGGTDTAGVVDESISGSGDTIHGNDGDDVVLGDNGTIAGYAAAGVWRFFDLATSGQTPNAHVAGKDFLYGDDGVDRMFGQGDDDTVSGGGGDDRIQGNAGKDTITGDAGADDIVGGNGTHTVSGTVVKLTNHLDDDDVISGSNADGTAADDKGDAILGDNGQITRPGGNDANTLDAKRDVELFDMGFATAAAKPLDISGGDSITGWSGRDIVAGQAETDTIVGGEGDDYLEGNAGSDVVSGDNGDDDVIGGSSEKSDGLLGKGAFPTATNAVDLGDALTGGAGHDAMAGDNAVINRRLSAGGVWLRYGAPWADLLQRDVLVPSTVENALAFGADSIDSGTGNDEVHGELGGDTIAAHDGEDTVVGDLGKVTTSVLAGPARVITADASFVSETIDKPGSLRRTVELFQPDAAFNDVITAGGGNDVAHGGGGADTLDGNGDIKNDPTHTAMNALLAACANDGRACDKDALWGDNGNDVLWGGPDRDHLFGGYGLDRLDVVLPGLGDPTVDFKGADIMYGGWDSDEMQADLSRPNPNGVDKMIDSTGVYNAYYVCESAYGGNSVMRLVSPSMITFIQTLSQADGAKDVVTKNSSGWLETGVVFSNDNSKNSSPPHADSPASGRCDPFP